MRTVVVGSTYFLYDSQDLPPPARVRELIAYCHVKGFPLIMGCDANSHHVVWESTNINARGEALLQFLLPTALSIVNAGKEPTFVNSVRREVIDLTLCSNDIERCVRRWRVSREPSSSDHRYIRFEWAFSHGLARFCRNPRKADWDVYRGSLARELEGLNLVYRTNRDLDCSAEKVNQAIKLAFEGSCRLTAAGGAGKVAWWTGEL